MFEHISVKLIIFREDYGIIFNCFKRSVKLVSMKLPISALVFSLVFPLLHQVAIAQVAMPVFGKQSFISGYSKALHGESMQYASLYPQYVKEALLTRCTDGQKSIEWET